MDNLISKVQRSGQTSRRLHNLFTVTTLVGLVTGALRLDAQTSSEPLKAGGVTTPGVRRSMSDLRPLATFQVGGYPDWMVVASDSVWVASDKTNRVVRLDARTNTVAGFVDVGGPCSGLAAGFGSLWVPSCAGHSLVRIDLKSMKVVATIPAGPADSEGGIATGAGSVWMVMAPNGVLARIDPSTNRVLAKIEIPKGSYAVAFENGSAWITSSAGNLLTRVDAATNTVVSTTDVGKAPRFLTVGAGSVWTLNQGDGTISRVDATSGKAVATIQAGLSGHGGEIAYGEGSLWVTLSGFPITKIDPATNRLTQQWVGKGGDSIRAGLGSIWLTNLDAGVVWRLDPALQ
jgi:virginiamycin B lyase